MHRCIMVYGPKDEGELAAVISQYREDVAPKPILLGDLTGHPASCGPWNLVIEEVCRHTDRIPVSVSIVPKSGFDPNYADEYVAIGHDAVLTYEIDPESGARMCELYLLSNSDRIFDWYEVPGRFKDHLAKQSPDLPAGVSRLGEVVFNPKLVFSDDVVDKIAGFRESHNVLSMEEVAEAMLTELEDSLYSDIVKFKTLAKRRIEIRHLSDNMYKLHGTPGLSFYEMTMLGRTRDQIQRYNAIVDYISTGVIVDGVYYDALYPVDIESVIALGERVKALPPETTVWVVDVHR